LFAGFFVGGWDRSSESAIQPAFGECVVQADLLRTDVGAATFARERCEGPIAGSGNAQKEALIVSTPASDANALRWSASGFVVFI
jgi:hypothetical protein